jgi:hypothetical protein
MKYTVDRFFRLNGLILPINGHQDLAGFKNLPGLKIKKADLVACFC